MIESEFCTCSTYPVDSTGKCLFCGKVKRYNRDLANIPRRWLVRSSTSKCFNRNNLPKVVITKCLLCGKIAYSGDNCLNVECLLYRRKGVR